MNIGIDISQIVYKGTGVARFTQGLTEAILNYDKVNKWTFFFSGLRQSIDPNLESQILSRGHKLIKWKLPPTLLAFLWNDLRMSLKLFDSRLSTLDSLNWFITSDWTEPPLKCPKATIVHDLVFKRYPETVEERILRTQEKRLKLVKKESRVIFADSSTTKADLQRYMGILPNKIKVIYPGATILKVTKNQVSKTRSKYNLTKPFILTVGKVEPRKNLSRLIDAFQEIQDQSVELIIAGPPGWDSVSSGRVNRVRFLGYVENHDLAALYQSCIIFAYPSLYEGFGYPVVEAMMHGAPVATSNTSSLAEIGESAAYLFDPIRTDTIAAALSKLLKDKKLRDKLKKQGLVRAKNFIWQNYYNELISTLQTPS